MNLYFITKLKKYIINKVLKFIIYIYIMSLKDWKEQNLDSILKKYKTVNQKYKVILEQLTEDERNQYYKNNYSETSGTREMNIIKLSPIGKQITNILNKIDKKNLDGLTYEQKMNLYFLKKYQLDDEIEPAAKAYQFENKKNKVRITPDNFTTVNLYQNFLTYLQSNNIFKEASRSKKYLIFETIEERLENLKNFKEQEDFFNTDNEINLDKIINDIDKKTEEEIKNEKPDDYKEPLLYKMTNINGVYYIENNKYIILKNPLRSIEINPNKKFYNVYKVLDNGLLKLTDSTMNLNKKKDGILINIENKYLVSGKKNNLSSVQEDVKGNRYKFDGVRDENLDVFTKNDGFYYDTAGNRYILTKDNNNKVHIYRAGYFGKITELKIFENNLVYNEKGQQILKLDFKDKFFYLDSNKDRIGGIEKLKPKLIENDNLFKLSSTGDDYLLTKKNGQIIVYKVDDLGRLTKLKTIIKNNIVNVSTIEDNYLFDFNINNVHFIDDDNKFNMNIRTINKNYTVQNITPDQGFLNFHSVYQIKKINNQSYLIINTIDKTANFIRYDKNNKSYKLSNEREILNIDQVIKSNGVNGLGSYRGGTTDDLILDLTHYINLNKGEFNNDFNDFNIYRRNHYDSLQTKILFGAQKQAEEYMRSRIGTIKINNKNINEEQLKYMSYRMRRYFIQNNKKFNKVNIDKYLVNDLDDKADYSESFYYLQTMSEQNKTDEIKLYNANEESRTEHILNRLKDININNLKSFELDTVAKNAYKDSLNIKDENLDKFLEDYYNKNSVSDKQKADEEQIKEDEQFKENLQDEEKIKEDQIKENFNKYIDKIKNTKLRDRSQDIAYTDIKSGLVIVRNNYKDGSKSFNIVDTRDNRTIRINEDNINDFDKLIYNNPQIKEGNNYKEILNYFNKLRTTEDKKNIENSGYDNYLYYKNNSTNTMFRSQSYQNQKFIVFKDSKGNLRAFNNDNAYILTDENFIKTNFNTDDLPSERLLRTHYDILEGGEFSKKNKIISYASTPNQLDRTDVNYNDELINNNTYILDDGEKYILTYDSFNKSYGLYNTDKKIVITNQEFIKNNVKVDQKKAVPLFNFYDNNKTNFFNYKVKNIIENNYIKNSNIDTSFIPYDDNEKYDLVYNDADDSYILIYENGLEKSEYIPIKRNVYNIDKNLAPHQKLLVDKIIKDLNKQDNNFNRVKWLRDFTKNYKTTTRQEILKDHFNKPIQATSLNNVNRFTQQQEALNLISSSDVHIKTIDRKKEYYKTNEDYKKLDDGYGNILDNEEFDRIKVSYLTDKDKTGVNFNTYYKDIIENHKKELKIYLERELTMSFYTFIENFNVKLNPQDEDKYIMYNFDNSYIIRNIPLLNNTNEDFDIEKNYNTNHYSGLVLSSIMNNSINKESKIYRTKDGVKKTSFLKHSIDNTKNRISKNFFKNSNINEIQFKYFVLVGLLAFHANSNKKYTKDQLNNIIVRIINLIDYTTYHLSENKIDMIKNKCNDFFYNFDRNKNSIVETVNNILDYLFKSDVEKINFYTLHNHIQDDLLKLIPNISEQFTSKDKMRQFFISFFDVKNKKFSKEIFEEFEKNLNIDRRLLMQNFTDNFADGSDILEKEQEGGTEYKVKNIKDEIIERVFIPNDKNKKAKTLFINEEGLNYERREEDRQEDLNKTFQKMEQQINEEETDEEEININSDDIEDIKENKNLALVEYKIKDNMIDTNKLFFVTNPIKIKELYNESIIKPFFNKFLIYMNKNEINEINNKVNLTLNGDLKKLYIPPSKVPSFKEIINDLPQKAQDIFEDKDNNFLNKSDDDFKDFMNIYLNIGYLGRFRFHFYFKLDNNFIQHLPEKYNDTFKQNLKEIKIENSNLIYNNTQIENAEKLDLDKTNILNDNLKPSISDLRFMDLANFSYILKPYVSTRFRRKFKKKLVKKELVLNENTMNYNNIQYYGNLNRVNILTDNLKNEFNNVCNLFNIDSNKTKIYSSGKAEILFLKFKDILLISVRGTDPTELLDITNDLNINTVSGMHKGFYNRAQRLLRIINLNPFLIEDVNKIYSSGHSLGSVTSLILIYLLLKQQKLNIQNVVFAVPKLFYYFSGKKKLYLAKMNDFDKIYNQSNSFYKLYNAYNDPVPQIPPNFYSTLKNNYILYEDHIEIDNRSIYNQDNLKKGFIEAVINSTHSLYPNYKNLFLKNIKKDIKIVKENPFLKKKNIKVVEKNILKDKIRKYFDFLFNDDNNKLINYEKDIEKYYNNYYNELMPNIPQLIKLSKSILNNNMNKIINTFNNLSNTVKNYNENEIIKFSFYVVVVNTIKKIKISRKNQEVEIKANDEL